MASFTVALYHKELLPIHSMTCFVLVSAVSQMAESSSVEVVMLTIRHSSTQVPMRSSKVLP